MFRQALQTIAYFTAASLFASATTPSEPGGIFQKKRTELIGKYDQNGDGRLNAKERETMRIEEKNQRIKPGGSRKKDQRSKEFLAKYDSDKDGDINGEEWGVAWRAETEQIYKNYDVNKNGELDDDERKKIKADVKAGKFKDERAFIARRAASEGEEEEKEEGFISKQKKLQVFDRNGDGIADADELKAVRKSRNQGAIPSDKN